MRGNGKIIQDLEGVFRGAGWHVIKVIWGPEWDSVFSRDREGALREALNRVVDGEWQRLTNVTGADARREFFGKDPRLLETVSHLSDEELGAMRRGGHSLRKVHAAYQRATELLGHGAPIVILAHTVKGWQLGEKFSGSNVTHQQKKFKAEELTSLPRRARPADLRRSDGGRSAVLPPRR